MDYVLANLLSIPTLLWPSFQMQLSGSGWAPDVETGIMHFCFLVVVFFSELLIFYYSTVLGHVHAK